MQTPEQRKKVSEIKDLWIDIGTNDKKQTESFVDIGDPLVIDYGFDDLKNDIVVGRAFDNRSGAFVVLEAIRKLSKSKTNVKVHAVATSQEEIGLRGAQTSSFEANPDVAIAVDVTFATDHPQMGDVIKRENIIKLGGGPVLSRGPNMNPKLFELIVKTAKENKIPLQINAEPRGTGTDANAIQLCRSGVPTCLISIPLRYMHSPCELVHLKDIEHCISLISKTVEKFQVRQVLFLLKKMFNKPIHVGCPNIGNKKLFFQYMEDIFNRKWLTNDGYYLKKLETEISNFIGVKHSIINATVGLEIVIRSI